MLQKSNITEKHNPQLGDYQPRINKIANYARKERKKEYLTKFKFLDSLEKEKKSYHAIQTSQMRRGKKLRNSALQ